LLKASKKELPYSHAGHMNIRISIASLHAQKTKKEKIASINFVYKFFKTACGRQNWRREPRLNPILNSYIVRI